jgi:archaetidylinositol phosphate synthase
LSSTTANSFTTARRVNRSLTAVIEKRALTWMAERAPRWLTSDQLTMLGLLSQIGAGAFYVLSNQDPYWLLGVTLCIVLNWIGDSLDGTLARVRNQQRPR